MKIGVCTTDFPSQTIETLFDKIMAYGFSQIQFNFGSIGEEDIPEKVDTKLVERILNAANYRSIEIIAINGTFNMISPDIGERKQGIERFDTLAAVCRKLNCNILTLCTGTKNPDSMWKWHPDNSSEKAYEELLESAKMLIEIAEKRQVYLGVEIEASNVISTPELARRLLDDIGSGYLKIIMDCANLFHRNTAFPDNVRNTIKNAFDYVGNDIILAHGKDIVASSEIEFTSPGRGIIDYDYFLELLRQYNYRGSMMLHGIKGEDFGFSMDFMRKKIVKNNINHNSRQE